MIRKPRDLPPGVANAFVKDMKAYFAEEDRHKRDEIALRQLHVLREHQRTARASAWTFRRESHVLAYEKSPKKVGQ